MKNKNRKEANSRKVLSEFLDSEEIEILKAATPPSSILKSDILFDNMFGLLNTCNPHLYARAIDKLQKYQHEKVKDVVEKMKEIRRSVPEPPSVELLVKKDLFSSENTQKETPVIDEKYRFPLPKARAEKEEMKSSLEKVKKEKFVIKKIQEQPEWQLSKEAQQTMAEKGTKIDQLATTSAETVQYQSVITEEKSSLDSDITKMPTLSLEKTILDTEAEGTIKQTVAPDEKEEKSEKPKTEKEPIQNKQQKEQYYQDRNKRIQELIAKEQKKGSLDASL